MRLKLFMGMAVLTAAVLTSCGKNDSFANRQKEERKAVDKFINDRHIEVLYRYPSDGVFGENQYYLINDGLNEGRVYLHVVDSGNGNRAIKGRTEVLMRCSGEHIFKRDTFDTFINAADPIAFIYGTAYYISSHGRLLIDGKEKFNLAGYYLSSGVESALRYVGENATVRLIVCFSDGSAYQMYDYEPLYYDKVTFRFAD